MNELFDEIAYDKGGSVLRMLEKYLGPDNFKKGLQDYIKKFMYKNTEAKDLWNALEPHAEDSILDLTEAFITQTGFPKVSVSSDNQVVKCSQERFLVNLQENEDNRWPVPLVVRKSDNTLTRYKLVEVTEEIPEIEQKEVLTINDDYGGFFISQYNQNFLDQIGNSFDILNANNKLGIIHDLYQLCLFDKQSLSVLTDFVEKYLKNENNSIVEYYLIEALYHIYSLTEIEKIKSLVVQHSQKALEKIGYEPSTKDTSNDIFLRSSSLSSLSVFNDKKVTDFLNMKFSEYLKNPNSLSADLRVVTYENAVWNSDKNYQVILDLYEKSNIQEEKVKMLNGLIHTKNKELIKKTLDYSLGQQVRFGNVFYILNGATDNMYAKKIVLDWMIQNWSEFLKRVGGHGGTLLRRFVKIVVPECGIGNEEKVEKFLTDRKAAGLENTFEQVREELLINSQFVRKVKERK
jgi:aminopeptidase N